MALAIAAAGFVGTPAGATDISTSFWLRTSTAGANMPFHGRHNADSNATSGFYMAFSGTGNTVSYASKTGTTFVISGSGTAAVRDGAWHHIGFNYRQSNGSVFECYVDGVLDFTQTAAQAHGGASRPTRFGDVESTFSGFPNFSGDLAEMAVWTTMHTVDEIIALSKGYRPPQVRLNGLLHYIPGIRTAQNIKEGALTTSGVSAQNHPRVY